jgi:RNA polymerase sigma factor (sigma-70 family)
MPNGPLEAVVRHIRTLTAQPPAVGETDGRLLGRFASRRDEAAFAELVRRHGPLVHGVCRHVLGNEHDAEDAFQATFLVLADKAASLGGLHSLAGWLHGVACRTALNARKMAMRRHKHERRAGPAAGPDDSPPSVAELRELQAILDEEIGRLPEKYRAPFVLCCLEGRSKPEAAAELGWKEGTVSSRLAQARDLLRRRLAGRGVALSAALAAYALHEWTLPGALAVEAVRGALALAMGRMAEAGSAQAVGFARGTLKGLAAARTKAAVAWVALSLATAGAGLTAYPGLVPDRSPAAPAPPITAAKAALPAAGGREEAASPNRMARRLVGMWKPPLPLPGAVGPSLIEFKDGGASEWTSNASGYRVSYRVTGEDTLVLSPAPDCAVEPREVRFRLTDDTLTLLIPGGVLRLSSIAGGHYQNWELRYPDGMILHRHAE